MKLIRYGSPGAEKPGIYVEGLRLDCSSRFSDWNRDFFQADGLKELAGMLQMGVGSLRKIDPDERWASPIARPGMILCIGLNTRPCLGVQNGYPQRAHYLYESN